MKPSILAVIVLYQTAARDSVSVTSLAQALTAIQSGALRLKVVLFDNGPEAQGAPDIFGDEQYLSATGNVGLAQAYNASVQIAQEEGFEWLLTLDQDTSLPEDFLTEMLKVIEIVGHTPEIAAVVPYMRSAGRPVSPYTFRWGALAEWFPLAFMGVPEAATYALNSASLLRLSALVQAGGYDPRFWLDASDHAMFHKLRMYGKAVYVAGSTLIEHRLSVLDTTGRMSVTRYQNILAAESAFWDLNMNLLAGWERFARLVVRALRQMRRGETELRRVTLRHLKLRLLHSRRYRLDLWKHEVASRVEDAGRPRTRAPIVSVCMASYNGDRFIQEQIGSILSQLGGQDELIVVDDASSDRTRERVLEFNDPRIKLIEHAENRGVVETFEEAVRNATGDILFLSDGDDIWAPDKVEKVLRAFAENTGAQVVATGIRLIDEDGQPLDRRDFMKGRKFTSALLPNLIRNRFQGSAMAFRSSLLPKILPFPKRRIFLHDAWIGTCNDITGGGAVYLDEPMLYYRRHSSNFSKRMGLQRQIVARVQLVLSLAARWLKVRSRGAPMTPDL
jgi:GT2 family glycosyltransferase